MATLFRDGPRPAVWLQDHKDIRGACVQDTISESPVAANVVPWWLSRSVIGTVGLVGRRVRAKRRIGVPVAAASCEAHQTHIRQFGAIAVRSKVDRTVDHIGGSARILPDPCLSLGVVRPVVGAEADLSTVARLACWRPPLPGPGEGLLRWQATESSPSSRGGSRMGRRVGSPSPRKYFATRSLNQVCGSRNGASRLTQTRVSTSQVLISIFTGLLQQSGISGRAGRANDRTRRNQDSQRPTGQSRWDVRTGEPATRARCRLAVNRFAAPHVPVTNAGG